MTIDKNQSRSKVSKFIIGFLKITMIGFALIAGTILIMYFVPGWLRLSPPGSYLINRRWLIVKADSGDRNAMYLVAEEYFKIKMSYRDADLAKEWYLKAAERGHPLAISALSYDRKWLEQGLQLKVERCMDEVSRNLRFGLNGYQRDPEKADQLQAESIRIQKLRNKLPFNEAKRNSFNGLEAEVQFNLHRQSLERKFQQGHPELGMDLFFLLSDLNMDAGLSWLRKGAEHDPKCATFLAEAYQSGRYGLPEDKEAFYKWFLRSRELETQQPIRK